MVNNHSFWENSLKIDLVLTPCAPGNAFMLTFYRDAAALAAAREEQLRPEGYEETFDCIACTLVTNGES